MLIFYDSEVAQKELVRYVKFFLSMLISNVVCTIDEIQLPNQSLNFSKIKSIAELAHNFFKCKFSVFSQQVTLSLFYFSTLLSTSEA